MAFTEILPGIHYVGVNDRTTTRFESLWSLPYGVSYNSYLVIDEKVALIDTVDPEFFEAFLENLHTHGISRIDYIVLLHTEQDHSGSVLNLMKKCPKAKLVATAAVAKLMKTHLHIPETEFILMSPTTDCSSTIVLLKSLRSLSRSSRKGVSMVAVISPAARRP